MQTSNGKNQKQKPPVVNKMAEAKNGTKFTSKINHFKLTNQ